MDIYHENDRKQRHSPRGDRETVPLFLFTRTMSQSPRLRKTLATVAITTFINTTPELCYTYHMSVFCIQTGVLTTDK